MAVRKPGSIDETLQAVAESLPTLRAVWKHPKSGREVITTGEVQGSAFKNAGFDMVAGTWPPPNIGQWDPEAKEVRYSDQDVTMLREIAAEQAKIDDRVEIFTAGIETADMQEQRESKQARGRSGSAD